MWYLHLWCMCIVISSLIIILRVRISLNLYILFVYSRAKIIVSIGRYHHRRRHWPVWLYLLCLSIKLPLCIYVVHLQSTVSAELHILLNLYGLDELCAVVILRCHLICQFYSFIIFRGFFFCFEWLSCATFTYDLVCNSAIWCV